MSERIEGESRDWIKTIRPHLFVLVSVVYGATTHLNNEFFKTHSKEYLNQYPDAANNLDYSEELAQGGIHH